MADALTDDAFWSRIYASAKKAAAEKARVVRVIEQRNGWLPGEFKPVTVQTRIDDGVVSHRGFFVKMVT